MWNHELRQELRSMKQMSSSASSCKYCHSNRKPEQRPGLQQTGSGRNSSAGVTSVDADPFYLLFHQIPKQTFSMKLESYRRPNEVLLLYSISPEKSLCNLRPRSGISGYSVFPSAQGLSTSLVCNILRPLSRKHLKEGRSLPQLLHEQDFTPNHVLDVEKREDTVDAFCSTQNHFHVRTVLCTHGDTTLLAGKYHLYSLQELRCEAMVNWVEKNSKHTSFTQISFL